NHDHWTSPGRVERSLERRGYHVLRNRHHELRLGGAPLTIVGIDDAITGNHDLSRAFRGVRPGGSVIALSHAPNRAEGAAARGAALVLAGHTHGGHVRIGRLTERIFARMGARYLAGFYPIAAAGRAGLLYVSCGIGSSSVPVRAGAPAEVAIL